MVSNMKFDDAVLSSYLVKNLQPLTNADPNLLAKYVAALLKNNQPKNELEALCIEKLFDFLGDESKSFVQNLFNAFEKGTVPMLNDHCDTMDSEVASTTPVNSAARITGEAACNGGVADGGKCSLINKRLESDNGISGGLEEVSDDEDIDRNHKHRRRVSTSHTFNKDRSSQGFLLKDCDKLQTNGKPPTYDSTIPAAESSKVSSVFYTERNSLSQRVSDNDQGYKLPLRYVRENNHQDLLRGGIHFASNGLGSRFEHQINLSQGGSGRGRGALAEPLVAYEQKAALDGLDFNLPFPILCPTFNPHSSKPILGRINASQSSWAGRGQLPGVRTGHHDEPLRLEQVMQNAVVSPVGRSRCPDFEERGYCLRGDLCPMEHGANRIVVKDFQSLSKFNLPLAISCGRDVTSISSLSSTPSFSPNLSNPIRFNTRDKYLPMADERMFSKGRHTNNVLPEPDLYDPDQPLFNKGQPSALANGFKRLPSFRKDLEDNGKVLKRYKEQISDEGNLERYSSTFMPQGSTQGWPILNLGSRNNHDNDNAESNTWHIADGVKAERRDFVESYEPESPASMHEKYTEEEEDSVVRSASMKVGLSSVPQREVRPYSASLKPRGRWTPGPQGERAQRTLYVGCVPNVNKSKEFLNVHFQKFGEVVDIRIPSQGDRAFVQFSRQEEAEAALMSPEAVMGNRFIRLSWAKRDSVPFSSTDRDFAALLTTGHCLSVESEVPRVPLAETSLMKAKRIVSMYAPSEPNGSTTAGKTSISSLQTITSASSLKKQQELELMMEELRRKQDELARKREDFRCQLERYSKQGFRVTAGLRADQSSSISSSDSKADCKEDQTSSKQLALDKLEAGINKSHKEISALSASIEKALLSADSSDLGVVKDSVKITLGPAEVPTSTQLCQRGVKGSLVGTGVGFVEVSQWSSMHYKLDNRTTAFLVLPPFPGGLVDVSGFTEHFSRFGELSNVEVDDVNKGIKVTFYTRSAAEKAFLQGRCYRGKSLCFSWVKQSSSITAGASLVVGENSSNFSSKAVVELISKEVNLPLKYGGNGSQLDVSKVDGVLPEPDHTEAAFIPSLKINPIRTL